MLNHPIDPLVDCVFKALFGDPKNKDLLLSFVNAITHRDPPFIDLEVLNPYSAEEFIGDDLRVVDVRARDTTGAQVQLEVQLVVRRWLATRVLYTWADLYQSQIQRGEHFKALRPVLSIWVLAENLMPDARWLHRFQLWDPDAGLRLSEHLDIHTVELRKWAGQPSPLAPEDSWVYFLREARGWTELPPSLRTPLMEKAMSVLDRFAQKGEDYHRYQARMNYLREQAAIADDQAELLAEREKLLADIAQKERDIEEKERDLAKKARDIEEKTRNIEEKDHAIAEKDQVLAEKDQVLAEKDQVLAEKDQVLAEKDQVLAEKDQVLAEKDHAIAQLRARLVALGLDPDA